MMQLELPYPADELVVKSNRLVQARMSFTKLEHRIIAMLIAQLKKDDTTFEKQRVYIREVIEQSDSSSEDLYNRAEEICQKLLDQKVHVRETTDDGRRRYKGFNCMSTCEYVEGSGYIEAKFNDDMKPFLLQLKRRFTMYRLQFFLRLGSQHSMRIYELLKMREGISILRITVDELREILGLEHSYKYFSELKYHVIEKAREELREKGDIYFTYSVEYNGRSAERVQFFIHQNASVIEEMGVEGDEASDSSSVVSSRNARTGGAPKTSPRDEVERLAKIRQAAGDGDAPPASNGETGRKVQVSVEDRTEGPTVNAMQVFLMDLTQEEIDAFAKGELEALHAEARERAEEANGGKRSEMVLTADTLMHMKRMWRERRGEQRG